MKSRLAYGTASLILVILSVVLLLIGVFWMAYGLGYQDSNLVLRGSFALMFGAAIGALANSMK